VNAILCTNLDPLNVEAAVQDESEKIKFAFLTIHLVLIWTKINNRQIQMGVNVLEKE
jgi:hypothetical protein